MSALCRSSTSGSGAEETSSGLAGRSQPSPAGRRVAAAVEVEALEATCPRLEALGCARITAPLRVPGTGRPILCRDPEGLGACKPLAPHG